jgi:CheY-like chemotaxis protein
MLNERRHKVLVVEDEIERRTLIRKDLERANYWVLEANRMNDLDPIPDGDRETIPSVRYNLDRHYFHAAVIDLRLIPEDETNRGGKEALHALRSRDEGTKSVVLTGYGSAEEVRDLLKEKKLDAFDYLSKNNYDKLLKWLDPAVTEAKTHRNTILAGKVTYQNLVKQPSMSEVRNSLGVSGEEIRSIFATAVEPYLPYEARATQATFETLTIGDKAYPVLLVTLWSRYLGACIKVRIGPHEPIQFRVLGLEAVGKKPGVDFVQIEVDQRDKVIGLVEYDASVTVGDLLDAQETQTDE